jgi:hypothetical protein
MKKATLYWIRVAEHTDIFTQGYVGVSINHTRRFNDHKKQCAAGTHANPHLTHAFTKYGHDGLILEELFVGPKEECYLKEAEFRPNTNVGWNIAPGGHRGPGWAKGKDRTGGRATIKEQQSRPLCSHCKFALGKPNGKSKHGFQKWHRYCEDCAKSIYNGRFKHLQHKRNTCEECSFVPEDRIQLDLIFIDGNKRNKTRENLLTLCANCARLHNKKVRTGKKSILNATVDGDTRIY